MIPYGEGRCCECDCITGHHDGDDWICPDCLDDAIRAQASEDRHNDPRHGQAAELNKLNYSPWSGSD